MTTDGPPIIEGKGGHLREFDWDGKLVWEYVDHAQHHDFRRLANGNTLYLGWEKLSDAGEGSRQRRRAGDGAQATRSTPISSRK